MANIWLEGEVEQYPGVTIKHSRISNVFVRMLSFAKAGDTILGHKHPFDHASLVAAGRVKVEVDGVETELAAPHLVLVRKDKVHRVTALDDNSVWVCIHALRTGKKEEDIIDPDMVPEMTDVPPGKLPFDPLSLEGHGALINKKVVKK